MKTHHPPRLALWLLSRVLPAGDPLTGDLLEEFVHGRSRLWFWRQTFGSLLARREHARSTAPLGLAEDRLTPPAPAPPWHAVNLTASPLYGVGGLGLAALALLISLMSPGSWLVALAILLNGILLGALLAYVRHRRTGSGPPRHSPLTRD